MERHGVGKIKIKCSKAKQNMLEVNQEIKTENEYIYMASHMVLGDMGKC